jgi:hypothetical protein
LPFQVPRNRYWGLHPPPKPLEDVVDDGLLAIQRATFLRKAGVETLIDDDFLSNPPSRADLLESAIQNITRCLISCGFYFFCLLFISIIAAALPRLPTLSLSVFFYFFFFLFFFFRLIKSRGSAGTGYRSILCRMIRMFFDFFLTHFILYNNCFYAFVACDVSSGVIE